MSTSAHEMTQFHQLEVVEVPFLKTSMFIKLCSICVQKQQLQIIPMNLKIITYVTRESSTFGIKSQSHQLTNLIKFPRSYQATSVVNRVHVT